MSEKWIRLPDGTRYLAQVRDTYEAPAEPRQPDVAKRTRQQHAEYLAIIDARLDDGKSISETDGRFLLDEIDRRARESQQKLAIGVVVGVGLGATLAGLTGWALTRQRSTHEEPQSDEDARPPASDRR